jgi:sugar phosphate isomerase/epimerase
MAKINWRGLLMKFGTTTIPIAGWIINPSDPEGMRAKRIDAIRKIVKGYGLDVVELSLDLGMVYPDVFDKNFYQAVAELQKELDFTCTIHLPFMWLDCASLNETIRQASVESIRQAYELVDPLLVDNWVLHLWGSTTIQISELMQESIRRRMFMNAVLEQAEKSLEQIKEFINPFNLCVETLEAPDFDFVMPLLKKHDVQICLDIGHLAWQGGGEISFLERNIENIREIHLHDARVERSGGVRTIVDHLALGRGQIEYRNFMQKLLNLGYRDVVILENNSQNDLELSIARIEDYV